MYTVKNLERYIKDCFEQAALSENRHLGQADYTAEFIVVDDDVLIPFFSCKYGRVLRRVRFRLQNNLKKNFGLRFNEYPSGFGTLVLEHYRAAETEDKEVWNYNAALAFVVMKNGKKYSVENTDAACPGTDHIPYVDIPAMRGFDVRVEAFVFWSEHKTFADYRELYKECYGTWPEHKIVGSSGIERIEC